VWNINFTNIDTITKVISKHINMNEHTINMGVYKNDLTKIMNTDNELNRKRTVV
jgi:septum formation topological specificity factor MinE